MRFCSPDAILLFGNNAKQFVSDAVFGKAVANVDHGTDRYERTLGDFIYDGQSLNLDLVVAGLASHYKTYSDDEQLAAAELEASAVGMLPSPLPGRLKSFLKSGF